MQLSRCLRELAMEAAFRPSGKAAAMCHARLNDPTLYIYSDRL